MNLRLFASAAAARLFLAAPASADAACCKQGGHEVKAGTQCCADHEAWLAAI
jgi:hypothetical protein